MAKAKKLEEIGTEETTVPENHYEEWHCQIKVQENGEPQYEKLKKLRDRVLLRDDQAEILNTGRLYGGNAYANLYFRPE